MADADTQRLFFALWPDDATRDALDRTGKWLHKHRQGRRMRADTLHLTLAFLGNTSAAQLEALLPHVETIRVDAFELILDLAGYWPRNRIGWLGSSQPSAALAELARAVRVALLKTKTRFDAQPFVPHVTLLRNSADGEMPGCAPVHWPVRDFVLACSRTGADGPRYELVKRWPLVRSAHAR